jgi:hypothetical protein
MPHARTQRALQGDLTGLTRVDTKRRHLVCTGTLEAQKLFNDVPDYTFIALRSLREGCGNRTNVEAMPKRAFLSLQNMTKKSSNGGARRALEYGLQLAVED